MKYQVFFTGYAQRDLEDLYEYVAIHDSQVKADFLLNRIEQKISELSSLPERGTQIHELRMIGIKEYREIFFKPYRIIYRIIGKSVYIYLLADGRRDMITLLQQRLLGF